MRDPKRHIRPGWASPSRPRSGGPERPGRARTMTRPPRVSVVVSHFDRALWLPEALASIRAQTYLDYEILLVDDAGPSPAFAARTAAAFGARHVRRDGNGGVAATRNSGVRAARGDLVAYLDDDDL